MFVRVKSSILSGAFGSLLTVFLMYHILKFGVTETYTHYLDSTEITNYTLIESLLLQKASSPELELTPNSRSDNVHLSLNELKYLAPSSSQLSTATIIIQYHSIPSLQLQLESIQNQINFKPINTTHIICDTEKDKATIEKFIFKNKERYQVSIKKEEKTWYQHIDIDSDFVIVMDKQVVPGPGYFNFIIGLLNKSQFHHTFIGTEQQQPNICQQDEAHYVHEINDIYILRREWYSVLNSDISISQALLESLNIPSMILPKALTNQQLHGNTKNSCINVHPNGILFIKEKEEESAEMDDLICNFANQNDVVHLVAWGHSHKKLTCSSSGTILYHSVVKTKKELDRIIDKISPSVVLYEKTTNIQRTREGTTFIGLPTESIPKVASWITDLSFESLQKWHTPKINIVLTTGGKRIHELKRLLNDIQQADYLGDENIDLSIVMDEKSDKSVYAFANSLSWNYGDKNLRHRISGVHQMQIFTEAWYPSNDDEYAVMLDDRIELSNSFYIWLKYTLLKYRYVQEQQQQTRLFGISLYSPRIIDTDPSGRQLLISPKPSSPYLMQVPNSIGGALYFPEYWREFHDYITARLTDQATVKRGSGNPHLFKDSLLTIAKSNKWASSWRKYFDEMIYMRGYVMLYPSFNSGYSTIATLPKTTIKNKKKLELYNGAEKLYRVTITKQGENIRELPDLEILPVLDLHGKLVQEKEVLIERGHYLQSKFSACKPILNHKNDPSDMLCPFNHWIQVPVEQITPIETKTIHLLQPASTLT